MLFMHILDDYTLQQGILANLKQKAYWQEHAPDPKYKHDYIMALAMHGCSWSFMTLLPIALYYQLNPPALFYATWAVNAAIHAVIDHTKANKLAINLIVDQTLHLIQIAATWFILLQLL